MGTIVDLKEYTEEEKREHRVKVQANIKIKKAKKEVREVELKNNIRSVHDFKEYLYDQALGLSPAKIKKLKKELRDLFPEFARAATKDVVWMDEFLIAVEGGDELHEPVSQRLVTARTTGGHSV